MENMNNLMAIRSEANNSFTELKKTVYQMYPALTIEDIEEVINLMNKAEAKLNSSVRDAIVHAYNEDLMRKNVEAPRRSHKRYDAKKVMGFIIPF